jgi:hypothetical protein
MPLFKVPNKYSTLRSMRWPPAPNALAMLDELPVPIYTTDAQGAVTF